jgi:hypothetical protein
MKIQMLPKPRNTRWRVARHKQATLAWSAAGEDRDKAGSAGWSLWKAARYAAEALWEGACRRVGLLARREIVAVRALAAALASSR